jgi:hypothetical protein
MIFSISYDLRQPGRNYDDLYKTIKSAPGWAHAMESYWFISTSESVKVWSDRLLKVIDENDSLFVVDITGQPHQGWMSEDVWDWLKKHDRAGSYVNY